MSHLNLKSNSVAVDDSGTESGEEVNQKILVQVQGALANLESALPALDPMRRSSVVELLTKIQTSLKLSTDNSSNKPTPPPRKCWNKKATRQDRHTVGVSSEELQDARRWLEENGFAEVAPPPPPPPPPPLSSLSSLSTSPAPAARKSTSACTTPRSYDASAPQMSSFRPVKFVPPPPKRNHYAVDYIPEPSKQSLQNSSFSCPPLQHGVVEHLRDKKRNHTVGGGHSTDSSDGDDDVSDDCRSVSSAQRLLQFASSNDHGRKFRQGKRAKLKRGSNSVDDDHSSADEYHGVVRTPSLTGGVPAFEPKTASDKKYLALLRQAKEEEAATVPTVYNPLQGKLQGNWGNRFGRIKTTFERCATSAEKPVKKQAKTFWHDICKCPSDDSIAYRAKKPVNSFKPVWTGENGFSHAIRSAFKPVAQKPVPPLQPSSLMSKPSKPIHPKHLPLYNSSVTTAHRPFIYSSPEDNSSGKTTTTTPQWSALTPPGSGASDLTSCSASPSADFDYMPQPTVSRVMGSPQTANIVKRTQANHHQRPLYPPVASVASAPTPPAQQAPKPPARSPRLVPQQRSPTSSPVRMPSVLQKSESWHQMILGQSKAAARSPQPVRRVFAPSYETRLPKEQIAQKQNIVRQHFLAAASTNASSSDVTTKSPSPCRLVKLNDDIDKVDDTFESLFKEATNAK